MSELNPVDVDLGLDLGTGGPSWVAIDQETGRVIGVGKGPKFPDDVCEHDPQIWEDGVVQAMQALHADLKGKGRQIKQVGRIGLTGMMHGEVLIGSDGKAIGLARLWNHPSNTEQGRELTEKFGVKFPTRLTASRFYWTAYNQQDKAQAAVMLATPTIYLFWLMTGEHIGGIGECSGMFPIDPKTGAYFPEMLEEYDRLINDPKIKPMGELLPCPKRAGETIFQLNQEWAEKLGLPVGALFAPPEGDQEAALAASLISQPGKIAFAGGTSVCANAVCAELFKGVHPAVDHFLDANGTPINMVWLKNGTVFTNWVVAQAFSLFQKIKPHIKEDEVWQILTEMALATPADCKGLWGLPFMAPEPGLGFGHGGVAFIAGMRGGKESNADYGAIFRLSFLLTLFGVKHGIDVLLEQGCKFNEIIITGGVANSPELMGQMIADVLNMPARIRKSANEGGALGGAYLARFSRLKTANPGLTYDQFMANMLGEESGQVFTPDTAAGAAYTDMYEAGYRDMLVVEQNLLEAGCFHNRLA